MSDEIPPQNLEPSAEPPAQPPPPPPRKRHWVRWIAVAAAAIVFIIIVLILLAPAILSTGPIRRMVVAQVNQRLNGKLSIDHWSLGWGGPMKVEGVKVYDAQGREILSLDSASTQLGIWGALRGDYDLGRTTIDGLNLVRCDIDQDGVSNYQKLLKAAPQPAGGASTLPKPASSSPLPNVRGTITVSRLQGVITAAGMPDPLHIDPSKVTIEISDLNQPIRNTLQLRYHVGNHPAGTIHLDGTVAAITNRQVNLNQLSADETLKITDASLDALSPLLRLLKIDLTTGGLANGQLKLTTAGMDQLTAAGAITIADFKATGGLLQGDVYSSAKVNIPVDLSIDRKNTGQTLVNIQTAAIEFDQGKITVAGQAPVDALASAGQLIPAALKQGRPVPWHGGEGTLTLTADVPDLSAIANQLPHLLALRPDTKLTAGQLHHRTTLTLSNTQATIATTTDLSDVRGQANGKSISLAPLHLSASATALPSPAPALHDLKMQLSSGFASMSGGGTTTSNLKLTGQFDLHDLQAQLEPFVDLTSLFNASQPVQLTGKGTLNLATQGDPAQADAPLRADLQLALNDLNLTGLTSAGPIAQSRLAISAEGTIHRTQTGLQEVRGVNVTLQSGSIDKPLIDLAVTADRVTLQPELAVPSIQLARCDISDLSQAQKQWAAFIPPDFDIAAGSLSAGAQASYVNRQFRLTQPLDVHLTHLTLDRIQDGQRQRLLSDQPLTLSVLADQPDPESIHLADVTAKLGDAVAVSIKGVIAEPATWRRMEDVQITLNYDLAKLWPIVRPIALSPQQQQEYAQMGMSGTFNRVFNITGSYPADLPFNQAIQHLRADGGIALESFTIPSKGIVFGHADIPFTLANGVITTGAPASPATASTQPVTSAVLNAGRVRLDHLSINLTGPHPTLTTPDHYALLNGVALNSVFAQSILSRFLNNPLFADAKQADGRMDVTILQCRDLPLDSSMTTPNSPGRLSLQYSITGLQIGNPLITGLVQYLAPNAFNNNTLQGAIHNGTIEIAHGIVTHNTPISVDRYTLNLDGSVSLATSTFTTPMNLTIPTALFRQKELAAALPELTVPLTGTATQPQLDLGKTIQDNLGKGLLNQLFKPEKKTPKKNTSEKEKPSEPSSKPSKNPLQDLLKQLTKPK